MIEKKQKEYADKFGDSFPMMPIAWGRSEKEIVEIIDKCLKKNKDAYDLGYVDDNIDILY